MADETPTLSAGHRPGDLGALIALHGRYYAAHHAFGDAFEVKVAREAAEIFARLGSDGTETWGIHAGAAYLGGITVTAVGPNALPEIRFFLLDETLQGKGFGRQTLTAAMTHIRAQGWPMVELRTFSALTTARALYESVGFTLIEEGLGACYGVSVTEQRFRWIAAS